MIVVDSSVWVDYFNGQQTPETDYLDQVLGSSLVAITDLILVEVLQGFRSDSDYHTARRFLGRLTVLEVLGVDRAHRCAAHYRMLRKRGVTIRKTADALIASLCIEQQLPLLFSDRDFEPFVAHLGLRSAMETS